MEPSLSIFRSLHELGDCLLMTAEPVEIESVFNFIFYRLSVTLPEKWCFVSLRCSRLLPRGAGHIEASGAVDVLSHSQIFVSLCLFFLQQVNIQIYDPVSSVTVFRFDEWSEKFCHHRRYSGFKLLRLESFPDSLWADVQQIFNHAMTRSIMHSCPRNAPKSRAGSVGSM
jgi:hypothetical protein